MKGKPVLVLDTRRQLTTGENKDKYHIKLRASFRVSSNGKFRYVHRFFPTGVYAFNDEDLLRYQTKPKKLEQGYQTILLKVLSRANELLSEDPNIDPETFGNKLTMKGGYEKPLEAMAAYADELREAEQIGTANYYDNTLSAWQRFVDDKLAGHLTFAMVTPGTLKKFERWLLDAGRSITTVGMYCIAMRTIFNLPKVKKKLPPGMYPFGKQKDGLYEIPRGVGRKLNLNSATLEKVKNYRTINPALRWAVDVWLFSYYSAGMNFNDIARLKYANIKGDEIIYQRHKTIRKRRQSFIEVDLLPRSIQIIETYRKGDPKNSNDYVFGILHDGMTETQMQHRIHRFIAETNEALKTVCEHEGIPPFTTYWARGTYTTIMKRNGAPIDLIQESLDHSSPDILQEHYADKHNKEFRRKYASML